MDFLKNVCATSLHKLVLKKAVTTNSGIHYAFQEDITAFFVRIGLRDTRKYSKRKKPRFLSFIPIFVQTLKIGTKFLEFVNKDAEISEFSHFGQLFLLQSINPNDQD